MKADFYIELPASLDALPRIARRRGAVLEPISASDFKFPGNARVVAFAPASAVSKFRVPTTARSEAEARKAALYAVEDDLAQPAEDVHITLGPRDRDGISRDVFIVDTQLLKAWLTYLQKCQLGSAEIVPENSLKFPASCVLDFDDRLLVNGQSGLVVADGGWPEEVKQHLIQTAGLDGTVVTQADSLETLARLHAQAPGTSLSVTQQSQAGASNTRGLRAWLGAAALAVAAAAIWIGSVWIETAQLKSDISEQDRAARAQFRSQFAGAPEPQNIHLEVRRLTGVYMPPSRTSFRALSSSLYSAMNGSDTIRLKRLSYPQDHAALEATLQFANRADESAFRARLSSNGLSPQTGTIRDVEQGIEATITMSASP